MGHTMLSQSRLRKAYLFRHITSAEVLGSAGFEVGVFDLLEAGMFAEPLTGVEVCDESTEPLFLASSTCDFFFLVIVQPPMILKPVWEN